MSEPHLVITESSERGLRWWCSCGYDTNDLRELKNHVNRKDEHDRTMREQ